MHKKEEKMGQLIQLPIKRGNAAINMEAEFNFAKEPQLTMLQIRMERIKNSLNHINELMRSLKESNNVTPKK